MKPENTLSQNIPPPTWAQDTFRVVLIALLYFAAHWVAFLFPDTEKVLAAIWPAGGIGLAALLLNRRRLWGPILAGMFIAGNTANLLVGRLLFNSLGFMTANVLESLLCAWVIIYWCGERVTFTRVREVLALIFAAFVVNAVTACVGAGTAWLNHVESFWSFWETWWVADGLGILIVAPLIIAWWRPLDLSIRPLWKRILERLVFLGLWVGTAWFAFQSRTSHSVFTPQPYILVFLIAYAALRFKLRSTTGAIVIMSVVLLSSKPVNMGPLIWGGDTLRDRVLLAQLFIASITIAGYLLSSTFAEREQAESALHHSQLFMDSIIEQSPTSLWIADEHGTLQRMNQACRNILHLQDEEVVGKYNIFNDSLIEEQGFMPLVRDVFKKGIPASFVTSYDTAAVRGLKLHQTTRVVLDVNISPILDAQGKVTNAIIQHIDITDHRRAEDKLRESEDRYRRLVENAPDIVYTFSNQRGGIYYSPRVEQVLGYSAEYLYAHPMLWNESIHPDDRPHIAEILRDFAVGKFFDIEYRIQDARGNWLWLRDRSIGRDVGNGEILVEGLATDITENKRAGEALRASEKRAQAMFRAIPDLMFRMNRQGVFLDYKADISDLYTRSDIIGKRNRDITPPEFADLIDRQIRATLETGALQVFEYQLPMPERGLRHYEARMAVSGADEVTAIVRDVTERKQAEDALRDSEEKYRLVADFTYDWESWRAPDGSYIYVSPSCERITGHTSAEFLADPELHLKILYPEDSSMVRRHFEEALHADYPDEHLEFRIINSAGEICWMDHYCTPVHGSNGQWLGRRESNRDITARKQAEADLEMRNHVLQVLRNVALDIGSELDKPLVLERILNHMVTIFDADRGGGFYQYEQELQVLRLIGGSNINKNRIGTALQLHEGVAGRVFQTSRPLIVNNYTEWEGKVNLLVASPPSAVMGVPLIWDGKILGVLTVIANSERRTFNAADVQMAEMFAVQTVIAIRNSQLYEQAQREITERKLVEAKLRENNKFLADLFEYSATIIFVKDKEGRYELVNRKYEEVTGISREALIGHTDADYFPEEVCVRYRASDLQVLESGRALEIEDYIDRPEGRRYLFTIKFPLRADDGSFRGVCGITNDITRRKQAEEEIRQLNEHLEQRVEERTQELRDAQEKLVRNEKLAVLGQMAGSVGHELRNPLAVISNSIYFLKMIQPDASEKVQEYLARIERNIWLADKIVGDLLDFTRIKSLDRAAVSIAEAIRQTLERFSPPENVNVEINLRADLPQVYTDPQHLIQVLGNLILNACQAMKSGGSLFISAAVQNEMMCIAVRDTGSGISAENMKNIFEPLFTTKPKGIGLGLVVSKKLIDANNGRIEVQSELGVGSVFSVYLPIYKAASVSAQDKEKK